MKILIIEDEQRAVRQLENSLAKCNFTYELLATIDSVENAVKWFQTNHSPDLVFLDIQLADGLSFEIFKKTQVEAPIIFTTAFDQYAIKAFKVNSIDYLLKPIKLVDLNNALIKFDKSNKSQGIDQSIVEQLLANMTIKKYRDTILVKQGNALIQIKVSNLLHAYAEDGVTLGVVNEKRFVIDETIDQLFQSLDPNLFFKINRGQIVKKQSILKIESYFNHRVKLTVLQPKEQEFIVSRAKTTEFKNWMNS